MQRYSLNLKTEKSAKAYGSGLRISTKNATIVCKSINGMQLGKAKKFLERVLSEKDEINRRYYSKTTLTVLELLNSAEKNAEFKGLDTERLFVKASSHKSFTFFR